LRAVSGVAGCAAADDDFLGVAMLSSKRLEYCAAVVEDADTGAGDVAMGLCGAYPVPEPLLSLLYWNIIGTEPGDVKYPPPFD